MPGAPSLPMRILMISPMVPCPADDGGRVSILNMVRYFQRYGHQVIFVAPRSRANDSDRFGREVELHLIDLDPRSKLSGRLRYMFGALPYAAEKFFSRDAYHKIAALVKQRNFDAIHVEHLYMMRLGVALKETFGLPLVLHEQNLESEILRRYVVTAGNPIVRIYAKREFAKTAAFEKEMAVRSDLVFTVTEEDKLKLEALAPGGHYVALPHGVSLEALRFERRFVPDRLLFLTNFDWLPNRESFDYYLRAVHPRLISRLPSLKTVVVGKDLHKVEQQGIPPEIEFVGFLPDLNQASSLASIAVVPLLVGSGVRVKILELMAMGIVVVSTSIGAEGIAVTHGEHIIIADEPDAMASEIERLLKHPEEQQRLAVAARRFVESHHSEQSIGSIVDSAYRNLLKTPRDPHSLSTPHPS